MSVRKDKKSGRWVADVVVGRKADGRPDRKTRWCATKKEAEGAERALLIERDSGQGRAPADITFGEFVESVYWPQKTKLRGDTVWGYKRDLKLRLLPAFGDMRIDHINRAAIQKMLDGCETRKVATNARETLSSVLSVAVEMELIVKNPAGYRYNYPSKRIADPDRNGVVLGTFAEHRRVLEFVREDAPGEAIERILVLGLCFGLRKGEIFGLDWDSVDMDKREISITQNYVRGEGGTRLTNPKTEESYRSIPMTSYAFSRFSEWAVDDCEGPVVKDGRGLRMNPLTGQKVVRAYVDEHRVMPGGEAFPSIRIQSLRHSFGTAAVSVEEISKVSKWMGHTSTSTTYDHYVKPRLKDLHGTAGRIDEAFGSA